jgi:hypothetical protein
LPDVPEEDEEEDEDNIVGDPQTPSRRKRKRDSDYSSPVKRMKTATGTLPSVHDAEVSSQHGNEGDAETILPVLKTPSRRAPAIPSRRGRGRGRGRATAHAAPSTRVSNKGSPKKKRKSTGSGSDDSGSEYEAQSEESEAEVDQLLSDAEESEEGEEHDAEPDDVVPRTPSRRKRGTNTPASTPRRRPRATTLAAPTPHSKAALRARAKKRTLAVRPPAPDAVQDLALQLENVPRDPWLRAMHVLHVAARPEAQRLPCREQEYARVLQAVEELIEEGSGGCICEFSYLSACLVFLKGLMCCFWYRYIGCSRDRENSYCACGGAGVEKDGRAECEHGHFFCPPPSFLIIASIARKQIRSLIAKSTDCAYLNPRQLIICSGRQSPATMFLAKDT